MKSQATHSDEIRRIVRENYGKIAATFGSCCGNAVWPTNDSAVDQTTEGLGYTSSQIESLPEVARMGLGCGNPQAIAGLQPGETVLDLGSGAGFDCLLAAKAVGENGRVIGVDMTDGMVQKARRNAKRAGIQNVTFRLGEIERLPVDDRSVDVIISNCVVNLSPEKEAVFSEAYRVLKPGGRLAISDVVAFRPLPAAWRRDAAMHCACIGGAVTVEALRVLLEKMGFADIKITPLTQRRDVIGQWTGGKDVENYVMSAFIQGIKPALGDPR